ncbi:hypothetical protein I8751_19145 [Nostocaceae cyanobacterium CENA357]|uniref:Uncharacterized protein n=1 Tax=Atlanticothrix silvestris CENA357 TaxID=1725252 RepID=A0A8J7HG22_9CYAN|nr:hypothetical protein [Atlanticothrix silvestris]MBH8554444.1 hypothetical protein [Atlanticothrix silvestris CENA357]
MKLNSEKPNFAQPTTQQHRDWLSKSYAIESEQNFQTSMWVKLLEIPNPFSFDEALLLCPLSGDEWLAWIPDHGECTLRTTQFVSNR